MQKKQKKIRTKEEKKLLKEIWKTIATDKHSCTWDEEPHTMAQCHDAGFSIEHYIESLMEDAEII